MTTAQTPPPSGPLSLAIPEPAGVQEAGVAIDDLRLSEAGATVRPPVDESPEQMRDHAYALVRVLDDDGRSVGPWNPRLEPDALVMGLRHMLLVREFDRRMLAAQRQGKTSFYMQCTGEEAIACAFRVALRDGDMNFPTYRQQGLLVAAGYPLELMMSQVFSNELDPLHGRQMPVMYSSRAHGFFSVSGNLATQYIQAVGWSMASALQGDTAIAAAWIGDGATAESDFHAAMVFASTYRAPVVLNIVNNQWAISTPQTIARGAAATFAARAHGFGLPALRVDGNDYLAVHAAASWAIERARRNLGPTVIEWVTYRAGAHSSSDDPSKYRSADEVSAWPLGDPIDRLRQHLRVAGIQSEEQLSAVASEVEAEVADALAIAESHGTLQTGPTVSPSATFGDVYAEMPAHLRRQRQQAGY